MDHHADLRVQHIMIPQPALVPPGQSLQEVLQLMNQRGVGAILVVEEGDRLVGIFTERDLLWHAAAAPPGWRQRPVADWMTPNPRTIHSRASWETAMALLDEMRVRHLPVVDDGRLVGLVAARDLIAHRARYLDQIVQARTRELQLANQQLEERDQEQRLHLSMAGRLQARLLPERPPALAEIVCAAHYSPLHPLGGDHYDFAQPTPRQLGILIADASGHGIPAAMVAIMTRAAFANSAHRTHSPGQVLSDLNRGLHGLTGEHFVTAFYGVFDADRRSFTFANAGHPFPYRYTAASGECQPLVARGLLLGVFPDGDYQDQQVQLEAGDRLLFYTDGVVDCLGADEQAFGSARLIDYLQRHGGEPADMLVKGLAEQLARFRGGRAQSDDLTLLAAAVA